MTEPIRVLHFADVHIGMENFGKIDNETGVSSRVRDFLARLDDMVVYAREQDVDLIIFAGDAFKTATPSPTLTATWTPWPTATLVFRGLPSGPPYRRASPPFPPRSEARALPSLPILFSFLREGAMTPQVDPREGARRLRKKMVKRICCKCQRAGCTCP